MPGDRGVFPEASHILEAHETTEAALDAVIACMAGSDDRLWWVDVYCAVETMGLLREAARAMGLDGYGLEGVA